MRASEYLCAESSSTARFRRSFAASIGTLLIYSPPTSHHMWACVSMSALPILRNTKAVIFQVHHQGQANQQCYDCHWSIYGIAMNLVALTNPSYASISVYLCQSAWWAFQRFCIFLRKDQGKKRPTICNYFDYHWSMGYLSPCTYMNPSYVSILLYIC